MFKNVDDLNQNKYNMKIKNIYGIDVSKEHLDICLVSDGRVVLQIKIKNSFAEIRKLLKNMYKRGFDPLESLFCMEYTGVYNNILLQFLYKSGYQAWVESSKQIMQSAGILRGKTDKVDSERIAFYAAKNLDQARIWKPKRAKLDQLDALLKNRKRMLKVKNQLAVAVRESKRFNSKEINILNERINRSPLNSILKTIKMIDKEIAYLIESDEVFLYQSNLAKSVIGVGNIIAATVIVKTNEFKTYQDPRKFACQAGVAPFDHTSGKSIRGRSRVSHMADKSIKTLLHLAAMSAINCKGELQDYYKRKTEKGKNKMSVLNAIRNKIIHRIFAAVNRGTPYQKFNNFVFG